ncbi:MAG: Mur ligase family protein [Firmicutes bacterium]|jgi:UDP-N-acetylmuramyl tripeptide synthase|nr:Mur ligase family protein [Bacillota bacterium]
MGLRGYLALWVAKAVTAACRTLGRGGSTLPGRVALLLDPRILSKLAARVRLGNLVVTGTNGKTTTSRMIGAVARKAGLRVVSNRSGANLIYGVASSYIQASDLLGRPDADVGIIEVDEATVPTATRELNAHGAVATNFFRDQLDRFGELLSTVLLVKKGFLAMPPGSFAVLNCDDPLVSNLGRDYAGPILYYGVEDRSLFASGRAQTADITNCLDCGAALEYDGVFYAHLGLYRCSACGLSRRTPDVALLSYTSRPPGSRLVVGTPRGELRIDLPVPGAYNAYNALAAISCCLGMGLSPEDIVAGLESYGGSFGRMESLRVGDRTVLIALVKNPAGFNEVIRTVIEGPEAKNLVICINDNYADGTDVSWLWDVDFERLAAPGLVEWVIASGLRAEDMALRLKYAGLDPVLVTIENDLRKALELGLSRLPPGGTLYVLPTYTAMLGIRRVIHDMGYARMFWED